MRISDWSSDVSLPILHANRVEVALEARGIGHRQAGGRGAHAIAFAPARDPGFGPAGEGVAAPAQPVVGDWPAHCVLARKSVVMGKRVEVRLDLGGRRLIKKYKAEHTTKKYTSK